MEMWLVVLLCWFFLGIGIPLGVFFARKDGKIKNKELLVIVVIFLSLPTALIAAPFIWSAMRNNGG